MAKGKNQPNYPKAFIAEAVKILIETNSPMRTMQKLQELYPGDRMPSREMLRVWGKKFHARTDLGQLKTQVEDANDLWYQVELAALTALLEDIRLRKVAGPILNNVADTAADKRYKFLSLNKNTGERINIFAVIQERRKELEEARGPIIDTTGVRRGESKVSPTDNYKA